MTYDACFGVVDVQLGPDGDIRDGNPLRMEKGKKILSHVFFLHKTIEIS